MEGMDVRSFDWDDGPLRRAYEIWEQTKKAHKKGNNGNKKRKWKVGDCCRAIYSADNSYYEAKVISLNGDFCTVEFLGYGDKQDVDLRELKESEGKKARKQQIKASEEHSSDVSGSKSETGNTTGGSVESYSSNKKKKHRVKKSANNATLDATMYEATFCQQYAAPPTVTHAPPSSRPVKLPFMPSPAPMPQCSVPPASPMMPQCPSLTSNPAIASMLSAWYMAGYYAGLRSPKTENHGCPHCRNYSSQSRY